MTKQITLEEAQKLVRFKYDDYLGWQVCDVNGNIKGDVKAISDAMATSMVMSEAISTVASGSLLKHLKKSFND